jgi:hypothetical protein
MNVLLSRAKWKLILVGSIEFLEKRFQAGASVSETEPLAFLRRMLDTLAALQCEKDENGVQLAATVPLARLIGAA